MKELAICIPTCNRAEEIKKILEAEALPFMEMKVDIIIYDSSLDYRVKHQVYQFINNGFNNVYYYKINVEKESWEKVFDIYKAMQDSQYKYVWMIHDHTMIKKEAIEKILMYLKLNGDFYFLKMHGVNFESKRYVNINDFCKEHAWSLTRFGTAILNIDRFIKKTNWNKIYNIYEKKEYKNFSHVGYYLERFYQVPDLIIYSIEIPHQFCVDITRYRPLSWEDNNLIICCEYWTKTIMRLSSEYYNINMKKQIIKTQNKNMLNTYNLIKLKERKLYGFKLYMHIKTWLNLVQPNCRLKNFFIAGTPVSILNTILNFYVRRKIFLKKRSYGNVVIYGAGRYANAFADSLLKREIEFDAFIVDSVNDNPSVLLNHNVYEAEWYLKRNSAYIIIAIASSGIDEVKKNIEDFNKFGNKLEYVYFSELI